jgi:hypothetical protein
MAGIGWMEAAMLTGLVVVLVVLVALVVSAARIAAEATEGDLTADG